MGRKEEENPTALPPLRCVINNNGENIAAPQFVLSMDFCEPRGLVPIKIMC